MLIWYSLASLSNISNESGEGVAMMFERMSKKRGWLEKMGVTDRPLTREEVLGLLEASYS